MDFVHEKEKFSPASWSPAPCARSSLATGIAPVIHLRPIGQFERYLLFPFRLSAIHLDLLRIVFPKSCRSPGGITWLSAIFPIAARTRESTFGWCTAKEMRYRRWNTWVKAPDSFWKRVHCRSCNDVEKKSTTAMFSIGGLSDLNDSLYDWTEENAKRTRQIVFFFFFTAEKF